MLADILFHQSQRCKTFLMVVNACYHQSLLEKIDKKKIGLIMLNRPPGSRNPYYFLKFYWTLLKIRPDIIHFHNHVGARLLFPLYFTAIRSVLTVHDVNKPIHHLKYFDRIIAISKAVQDDLQNRAGIDSTLIENGIPFKDVQRKSSPVPFHPECRFVQVSRLMHEKKGQHLLIQALAYLHEKFHKRASVTFIGTGESEEFLKQFAVGHGVEKYCFFEGAWEREKIYRDLINYDVLVQPSLFEGFGLTVVEGIAAGLPVIVSDGDGPMEIIGNGQCGYFFTRGNYEGLALTMNGLIEENERSITQKAEKAFQFAHARYDVEITSHNYIEEYRMLLGHDEYPH